MKLSINDKIKKDLFVALFQTLKNCSSIVTIFFKKDHLFIQGMDKSHVCLFEVNIKNTWFSTYNVTDQDIETVSIDSHTFHTIISKVHDSQNIVIYYTGNTEILNIDLETDTGNNNKGDYNKYFKIPLIDFESDIMSIPETEYEAEFSIVSKKMCEITSQMLLFGSDINFKCSEEQIDLITNGTNGEMLVKVPIDDLNEYSIVEDQIIDITYSLGYIDKMCLTNKLSNEIQFFLNSENPMKIRYDLGDDSSVIFYIAPKVVE
jgi:proliferating cell nuclear antigen PCNA